MTAKRLQDRVAFVTGSTRGIGKAIAEALAHEGCKVALNGFGEVEVIELQRFELEQSSGSVVRYFYADVGHPKQIRHVIDEINKELGEIDILVNNAGIQHVSPVHEFPEDQWDEIIAVNLSAVFHTSKAVLPSMIKRGTGRIVNISSVHGLVASINKAAYIAAKHGVVGLTKEIALEIAKHQITCNAICPAWVRTELMERQIQELMQKDGLSETQVIDSMMGEKQPIGRFLEAREIAALVVFLCTEEAGAINGTALPVDGGWLAQ